jgi:hypothetical protein
MDHYLTWTKLNLIVTLHSGRLGESGSGQTLESSRFHTPFIYSPIYTDCLLSWVLASTRNDSCRSKCTKKLAKLQAEACVLPKGAGLVKSENILELTMSPSPNL